MLKQALFLALLVLAGCGGSSVPKADDPVSTSTTSTTVTTGTWVAPAHYQFEYRPTCFCDNTPLRIEVKNGKVLKFDRIGAEAGLGGTPYTPTLEKLVADAKRAEKEATGEVDIDYDDGGIPVNARIDWLKNAIDDEISWTITNYKVLT